ncbi:acyltransferase [Candidatus Pantoea deserta]|uniref:Acyltransferase n=1 Tax=Candidatus Pantoea deserta TaxID=1869313 RepID=A0A3N4PKY9_9GAMM|nr:acyltransferase [Pantoea deserta]RPE00284.1 acyltransferase [Pantoea deserta]
MYVLIMVVSFCLALLFLRATSFHKGIYNGSGIKSISGLRALLASIVAFSHLVHYLYSLDGNWIFDKDYFVWFSEGNFFVNAGKFGVLLFFMISAFLFYRWLDNDAMPASQLTWKLLKSRVRRIVPMFWFSGLVIILVGLVQGGLQLNAQSVTDAVLWLFFIGSYHIGDFLTADVNAGVEWTLRLEWLLYLSIPLIYVINRATRGKYKTLLILGSIGVIFIIAVGLRLWGKTYTDPRPVLGFAMGYFAYAWRDQLARLKNVRTAGVACMLLAIFALGFTSNAFWYLVFLCCLTAIFFVVSSGNSLLGMLENKTLMSIGEVSYSLYLIHGVVLYFIKQVPLGWIPHNMVVYTLISTLFFIISFYVAKMTYLCVEKPFIGSSNKKKVAAEVSPASQDRSGNPY